MRSRRTLSFLFLGLITASAISVACADSVGTPSADDDGFDAMPPRVDSGKKDGTAVDGAVDEDAALPDAAKKDSAVKDATTDVKADVIAPADAGSDTQQQQDSSNSGYTQGAASTTLVINELDYDQVPDAGSGDTLEFVEILNKSSSAVSLAGLEVRFFNGSSGAAQYLAVPLTGSLAAGEYLVIRNTNVVVGGTAMTIDFSGVQNIVQNGPNDSIAIVDTATMTLIDTITYGTGGAAPELVFVETNVPTAQDSNTIPGSIIRDPNGTDTNNSNADWKFTKTPTPGVANTLTL